MKNTKTMIVCALGVATAMLFAPGMMKKASAQDQADAGAKKQMTTPIANVTPVEAMKAASAKYGGKAVMAIFEFDEGNWVYGVVVVKDHKLMEVDVDPKTGKAGDQEAVTPADEAKEFAEELTALQGM